MLFKKILEKKHSFQRLHVVSLLTTCFPPGLEGDLRPDLALYFFSIDLCSTLVGGAELKLVV